MKNNQQKKQAQKLQQNIRQQKAYKKDIKNVKKGSQKEKGKVSLGEWLKKFFHRKDIPTTAQQTISYQEMFQDGICQVNNSFFTKTIQFFDINYQLAQNEDKTLIFENYCDFLNYFDASIQIQLSFLNQAVDMEEYQKSIDIPDQDDDFNSIRHEYVSMLKNQLAKGNNGLVKTKYITFGIEADSLKAAKLRLERIEADILSNFKVLGVKARPLNGKERLAVLHQMLHAQENCKFFFDWNEIARTGLSTKDFIAPNSFNFQFKNRFQAGKTYGMVSFLQITAPELTDRMLAEFLDLDSSIVVNLHIQSIDQSIAIKNVKRKLSDLDKMRIEEQKKAVRAGYDMGATRSLITA